MKDFYAELALYTGRDRQLVEQRCQTAPIELAWQWEKYKDNPLRFYRESDLYIFDLTLYQTLLQNRGTHDWFRRLVQRKNWKNVLDYGGGVGEYTIIAANAGMATSFLEVRGSTTLEYALWRFERARVSPDIFHEGHVLDTDYDLVIAMDVFEHMEDPQPVIEQLAARTKFLIVNPDEVPYTWMYPQHISRYTLEPHFDFIERYLYQRIEK